MFIVHKQPGVVTQVTMTVDSSINSTRTDVVTAVYNMTTVTVITNQVSTSYTRMAFGTSPPTCTKSTV